MFLELIAEGEGDGDGESELTRELILGFDVLLLTLCFLLKKSMYYDLGKTFGVAAIILFFL